MAKYIERLKQDKESLKAEAATVEEAKAKAEVAKAVASLESQMATLNAAKNAALSAAPFNVNEILRLQKEAAQNQADLSTLKALSEELF